MHRILASCSIGFAALACFGAPLAAQISLPSDNTAYGTTSAEFLLLGAGARGMALGGSFAAISNDVSALYYNPAGVTLIEHPGAMVSTYSYVADTKYTWAGLAFPVAGGARAFGFQVGYLGFSGQPVYTVEQPDGTGGTYSVSETFVGGTFSENFSDRFSAGLTAKFIRDGLGDVSGSAFAVDFGTSFHVTTGGRPLRASFTIQNLGTTLQYSGTPLTVNVNRPPVAGQVDVPQEPQPASLQNKDYGLPVTFDDPVRIQSAEQQQVGLWIRRRIHVLGHRQVRILTVGARKLDLCAGQQHRCRLAGGLHHRSQRQGQSGRARRGDGRRLPPRRVRAGIRLRLA